MLTTVQGLPASGFLSEIGSAPPFEAVTHKALCCGTRRGREIQHKHAVSIFSIFISNLPKFLRLFSFTVCLVSHGQNRQSYLLSRTDIAASSPSQCCCAWRDILSESFWWRLHNSTCVCHSLCAAVSRLEVENHLHFFKWVKLNVYSQLKKLLGKCTELGHIFSYIFPFWTLKYIDSVEDRALRNCRPVGVMLDL